MERKKASNIPVFTVIKVLIVSYLVTAAALLALSALLFKFQLGESIIDGGIVCTYILSCFLGGFLMGKIQKRRKFLWGMIIGCAYYAVLLAVSVLMKQNGVSLTGQVFTSLMLCVGSGMLGGMLS